MINSVQNIKIGTISNQMGNITLHAKLPKTFTKIVKKNQREKEKELA